MSSVLCDILNNLNEGIIILDSKPEDIPLE